MSCDFYLLHLTYKCGKYSLPNSVLSPPKFGSKSGENDLDRKFAMALFPITQRLEEIRGDVIAFSTHEARCAFVILLMATYYMTEALPLAVTALMPVFAFPLLGIISTDAICRQSPTLIMLSFMLTTMFISMWISNTAAGAMMVPILDAILQELFKTCKEG
ncbi:hypothetical protein Avbf_14369 [Armadillidium vulgare]|nr:hypothetical protein Avbf_14369 [Armadillidium vulgare]